MTRKVTVPNLTSPVLNDAEVTSVDVIGPGERVTVRLRSSQSNQESRMRYHRYGSARTNKAGEWQWFTAFMANIDKAFRPVKHWPKMWRRLFLFTFPVALPLLFALRVLVAVLMLISLLVVLLAAVISDLWNGVED